MTYQNSIQEYGKLTGMAMPLVFFPSLVTSALATTLVPAISEAMSVKDTNGQLQNVKINTTYIYNGLYFQPFLCSFPIQ